MVEYTWICMEDEWRRTKGWTSIHEYEWRMNEEELKNGWVHEYELRMNEEELKDGWVCMNMYGEWIKKN